MLRLLLNVTTLVAAGALLAGCTATPIPSPTPPAPTRAAPPADVVANLSGTWTFTDLADGMVGEITLFDGNWEAQYECGFLSGAWVAAGDTFLATSTGGSMGCFDEIDPQPSLVWAAATSTLAAEGTGWTLGSENGTPTATLTNKLSRGVPPESTTVSVIPLASQFTVGSLEGRWRPLVDKPGTSFLEFASGEWTGSDGCNGSGGRWADLGDGYIIATPQTFTTQIGCENVPVAEWIGSARTAGFDGEFLVLFDASGTELGRFARN